MTLDEILLRLRGLPADERKAVEDAAVNASKAMRWVPNPGPQTQAYYCAADQLLYGGEAGGGKTDLAIGLATQEHRRSLLMRRINADVAWLVDRTAEVLDSRSGYNAQKSRWTLADGRVIDYRGCQHPGDEQRSKGRPKDFIGFDEACDFLETQVEFILGWLRTTDPGRRCRAVFATNPPTTAEGEWVVRWWAPWIDSSHPLYPTPMGELLWTCRGPDDDWLWFREPRVLHIAGGEVRDATPEEAADPAHRSIVRTVSRTFIRSGLGDNPDLARTNYRTQLQLLPEELRARFERGDFMAGSEDDEFQVIPTDWIRAAQDRWRPEPPANAQMTAIGVDVAQGGKDETVLAPRYGAWFAPLLTWPGKETKDGPAVAGRIVSHIRDAAQVNIDLGGGWGGSAYDHMKETEIAVLGVVPSETSTARTAEGRMGFLNRRAEITWRLREALDPTAREPIALPPDPQLRADLASYRWKLRSGGVIRVESKDDIKKRLGRSPDRGDAVILANASGSSRVQPRRNDPQSFPTRAKMGRQQQRAIRRGR